MDDTTRVISTIFDLPAPEAANAMSLEPAAFRKRVQPELPLFAGQGSSFVEARDLIQRVERAQRVVELHRRAYPREPSTDIVRVVLAALEAPATAT